MPCDKNLFILAATQIKTDCECRCVTQLYDSDKEPEHVLSLEELDEIYMNDYYGYDLEELRSMVDWDELGIDPNDI